MTHVLFVCVANSGRSVMADRLFREAAGGRHEARSAGSDPGNAAHPQVLEALRELGIDASDHVPRKLDADALAWADLAVSTCSEEVCPITPGIRRISWQLPDPKTLPLAQVRPIRDEIKRRVDELVVELDGQAAQGVEEMTGAGCPQREAWRLAIRLSVTAAVGGLLFILVGARLAAWITFGFGAVCAVAAAMSLHRHDHRSPHLRQ
jgi:arsenate reductase